MLVDVLSECKCLLLQGPGRCRVFLKVVHSDDDGVLGERVTLSEESMVLLNLKDGDFVSLICGCSDMGKVMRDVNRTC